MKIGIDIDGVLTDEHNYVLDNGTKYFSENNISYIVNRSIYDSEEIFGVSEDEYNNFWKEYIFEYSKNISIRRYAADIIKKLKEKGNEIFIITSRSFTTYENESKDKMQYLGPVGPVQSLVRHLTTSQRQLFFYLCNLCFCHHY